MKLASLRSSSRDGELVVVSTDLQRMVRVSDTAPTLQHALENWQHIRPILEQRYRELSASAVADAERFDPRAALSPLPRAYQWLDGSTYPAHMERHCRLRGLPLPDGICMYQGMSDGFLAPTQDIPAITEEWGIDFEAEVAIITDEVAYAVSSSAAASHIVLVMICNDVSLRNLSPPELRRRFGFVHAKPASAFSPVAVTPDELGDAWRGARLHRPLHSYVNGVRFGDPDAGAMEVGFDALIAHAAATRSLGPGTIIGSGTVSNHDTSRGQSCITERRVLEEMEYGEARTPFLRFGDRVHIEMHDDDGCSIFGAIDQRVARVAPGT